MASGDREPPGYHDLLDDLKRAGCPVCHAARRTAGHTVRALLSESVMDPGVRARLRAAHGFCTDHALLALRLAGVDGQGIGMLYDSILEHLREEVMGAARRRRAFRWPWQPEQADPLAPHRVCLVCEAERDRADTYLDLLASASSHDVLGSAARQEDRGICLPHLRWGLQQAGNPDRAGRLAELFLQGEQRIRADLAEYLRKQDHRYRHEEQGRERGSWRRALLWVTGLPRSGS